MGCVAGALEEQEFIALLEEAVALYEDSLVANERVGDVIQVAIIQNNIAEHGRVPATGAPAGPTRSDASRMETRPSAIPLWAFTMRSSVGSVAMQKSGREPPR